MKTFAATTMILVVLLTITGCLNRGSRFVKGFREGVGEYVDEMEAESSIKRNQALLLDAEVAKLRKPPAAAAAQEDEAQHRKNALLLQEQQLRLQEQQLRLQEQQLRKNALLLQEQQLRSHTGE
jgi:hypothetical protein